MNINDNFIESVAPNLQAIKNGKDLITKGKFVKLEKSSDGTFLIGECSGSGKSNYIVSADFINEGKPVFRCTCPSRQFPCKHAIGLLFAYSTKKKFSTCDIPSDIISKREKAKKREEKKEVPDDTVKKVNVDALVKKTHTQLDGLDILEKIISNITTYGLGTMNIKQVRIYEEQAKKLGDYYLTGVQSKLREFLYLFNNSNYNDATYSQGINLLVELNHLLNKGREYLTKKKEAPLENIDTTSKIEELLGNTWQLTQLKDLGLYKNDVRLIQLGFESYDDPSSHQFVDMGLWISLDNHQIYKTLNYRPYRAVKYIKEDDSCFEALDIRELYIYPGQVNQRVRYEEFTQSKITEEDLKMIIDKANTSYADNIKSVKNIIKTPLSENKVYCLLKFSKIGLINEHLVIENDNHENIELIGETSKLIYLLNHETIHDNAILGYYQYNNLEGRLEFCPLSIVTRKQIIRLGY